MEGQITQFLVSRSLQTNREKATWRTTTRTPRRSLPGDPTPVNFCPAQAHVEISVSVEVVWSLEYVLISDGGHNIKNNQEDRTSRESSSLPTLPLRHRHRPPPWYV